MREFIQNNHGYMRSAFAEQLFLKRGKMKKIIIWISLLGALLLAVLILALPFRFRSDNY
jgi:hypothetical protein